MVVTPGFWCLGGGGPDAAGRPRCRVWMSGSDQLSIQGLHPSNCAVEQAVLKAWRVEAVGVVDRDQLGAAAMRGGVRGRAVEVTDRRRRRPASSALANRNTRSSPEVKGGR